MALSNECNTNLEIFRIIWLDNNVHSAENKVSQEIIRTIINHLQVFDDEKEFDTVLQNIPTSDRIVLIVSGRLGSQVVPKIHDMEQLFSVYVYCLDVDRNKWANNFSKVSGIFITLDDLIKKIQKDHKLRRMEEESLSMINVFSMDDKLDRSATGIKGQFVHSQLLIDVLLRMKPNARDKKELIALCRQEYHDNPTEMKTLEDFEKTYSPSKAIWWYTEESFIYKMLNKALRVQNIDLLFLFRFFIRDIYKQLCDHQEQSKIEVFRGQWISIDELDKLKNSIGHFISMNSFLSTSKDIKEAERFLESISTTTDTLKKKVLFKITADPQVGTIKPFADISLLSVVQDEGEVLFMIGSIFKLEVIEEKEYNNESLTIIKMSLCGDKHGLKKLYTYMRKEFDIKETNLISFGNVLRSMGKVAHAEKYYRRLLHELSEDDPLLGDVYYNIGLVEKLKCDYDKSLESYQKAMEILMKSRSSDHVIIGNSHNGIGEIYWKTGNKNQALESFKEAVHTFEKAKLNDHVDMALFQDNIGLFHKEEKNYPEAFLFYARSLMIRQKCLPKNHPDLATSYNNVGNIRLQLHQSNIALEYFKQALEITMNVLPPDHPDIAISHKNLGALYEDTNQLKLSLESFQNASKIYHTIWPSNHPDVVATDEDIERVMSKLEKQ